MPKIPITSDSQWHQIRNTHIGASDIATLFEFSPYMTEFDLYHRKKGSLPQAKDTMLMKHGRNMEPIIASYIAEIFNMHIEKCNHYLEHPEYPFLGCTLDFYVVHSEKGKGILEIKNVTQFSPEWTDTKAPMHVELQMQHQLLVANAVQKELNEQPFEWGAIGSMHQGNPNDIRLMMRKENKKLQEKIINKSNVFWNKILNNQQPDIMGSKDYEPLVEMIKQDISQEEEKIEKLDLSKDKTINDKITEYLKTKMLISEMEKKEKEIKTFLIYDIYKQSNQKNIEAFTDMFKITMSVRKSMRKAQEAKEIESLYFNVKQLAI